MLVILYNILKIALNLRKGGLREMEETKTLTVHQEMSLVDEIENANKRAYCSIPLDNENNKKLMLKIAQKADKRVADILNTPIKLANVFIQSYEKVDEETGEVQTKVRTILIDDANNSYASASRGLYNSLLKLFAILGMPDSWEKPIDIKVVEVGMKNGGKTYVIEPIV